VLAALGQLGCTCVDVYVLTTHQYDGVHGQRWAQLVYTVPVASPSLSITSFVIHHECAVVRVHMSITTPK
jgi:hypothetical protein